MSAAATASLTIHARTLGLADVKALSAEVAKVGRGARATGAGGAVKLAGGLTSAGAAAAGSRGKLRSVEQEIERLQRRMDQERITAKARAMLGGPPGKPAIVGKLRTVEAEMQRLDLLQRNRAVTAQARANLGMGPSILTGHGFMSKTRQSIGLMRDLTVAGMGVRFALQSAAAGVGAMINPVREFEQTLATVKVKGGFSDAEMARIAKSARDPARSKAGSLFGARESASAAVELAASGLSEASISKEIPTVLKFAMAGELNTETAAATLVETAAQFGKTSDDFESIGNAFQRSADISTISVADLTESLSYVGPVARTAGIEFEETAAMLAVLGQRGIKASSAGTAMRNLFQNMVNPVGQAKKALRALHISEKQAREGLDDLPAFLRLMHERLAKFDKGRRLQILGQIFGDRGIASADILMDSATKLGTDGVSELQKFTDQVQNSGDAMNKAAEIMGNTTEGKIRKMNAAIEEARISLGEKFVPVVTKMTPKIASAAIGVSDFVSSHGDLISTLAVAIPSMVGMSFAVRGLVSAYTGVAAAAGLFGVEMGMGAGAAFGTSFVGAALPVIAAGLAGYALGTLIAEAIDAKGIGAKIYDAIHGATPRAGSRSIHGNETPEQRAAREEADRFRNDPILANIRESERGLGRAPETLARTGPWAGKLKIEIDSHGRARSVDLISEGQGPEIDVGTNVSP